VGYVPLEEAGSTKGEEFLVTLTPTHPQRDTQPTLSCHYGWAMGRGRGQPRVGAKSATLMSEVGLPHFVKKITTFTPRVLLTKKHIPVMLTPLMSPLMQVETTACQIKILLAMIVH